MASGNGDMVKFDLETLEPVENTDASDIVNEIHFLILLPQVVI